MRHLSKLLLLMALALATAQAQDVPPASSSSLSTETSASAPASSSRSALTVRRRHAASASASSAQASSQASADASAQSQSVSSSDSASSSDCWGCEPGGRERWHHRGGDNSVVSVGHDAMLPAGTTADSVVAVFGNAISEGEVSDSVVAVFGDARATAPVADSVVAVAGNVYINSPVQNVVAVLGNVELGPKAQVEDNVAIIGGTLTRDPAAEVNGSIERILPGMGWSHAWVQKCLLYARPLAIAPGLGWLWTIALGFLLLYGLLAALFPAGLERCVQTLEQHPGESVLTSLAALLLLPLVAALLVITVIGVAAIPFLILALICMTFFGKAAIFTWVGRRFTGRFGIPQTPLNTLLALFLGGIVVLLLYCVPVIGMLLYPVLGVMGLGVVLYALMQANRSRRVPPAFTMPPPNMGPPPGVGPGMHGPGPQPDPGLNPGMGGAAMAAPGPAFTPAQLLAMPRTHFWPRMGALLIDAVLVGMVIHMTLYYSPFNLEVVLMGAYAAVMWKLKGTTIGGIICNHRVVRLDGREMDWPTAIVRALGCFLSALPLGLGFIWIAVDEHQQAWHDKIAGTTVVRVPPGTSHFR